MKHRQSLVAKKVGRGHWGPSDAIIVFDRSPSGVGGLIGILRDDVEPGNDGARGAASRGNPRTHVDPGRSGCCELQQGRTPYLDEELCSMPRRPDGSLPRLLRLIDGGEHCQPGSRAGRPGKKHPGPAAHRGASAADASGRFAPPGPGYCPARGVDSGGGAQQLRRGGPFRRNRAMLPVANCIRWCAGHPSAQPAAQGG